MPVARSRQALMESLGAKQRNTVWSWCAVNDEERKVYFSVWLHTHAKRDGVRPSYIIQEPCWGIDAQTGTRAAARNDHDEKLALVFEQGYQAFGYFIKAKDTQAEPKEIEETLTSFVFSFELEKQSDGTILGYPKTRINLR